MSPADLPPLIVLSFNRPALLKTVLETLSAQVGSEIEQRRVCLFQDGAVNKYSRMRYARDDDIKSCIEIFHNVFPRGEVHASHDNLGVCENILRAEEYAFRKLDADCAYFFEDDMILSPVYLQMMDRLKTASFGARTIAYFAAYGDYYADETAIEERADQLMTLDHHWAFGLFRHQWSRIRGELAAYYAIVIGNDYARRDHQAIYDHYEQQGAAPRATSQDAAKAFACSQLGLWRCRTVTPFAQYVGASGAHMSQEHYDALGFHRTRIAQVATHLRVPSETQIHAFIEDERRLFRAVCQNEMVGLRQGLNQTLNPMRRCTREDVRMVYELLLHRLPETSEIYDELVSQRLVFSVVRDTLASAEFQALRSQIEP